MKQLKLTTITILILLLNSSSRAQQDAGTCIEPTPGDYTTNVANKQKVHNFFIISQPKKGKLDLGSRYSILRAKMKSFFRQKKFVAIVAKDIQMVSAKMQYRLDKYNTKIGTLWFDSHGTFKKGYSVFFTGKDEFNYRSVNDTSFIKPLQELAVYADENSKVVIGSCYGGATFHRKSLHSNDTTRMNGDSLMMGLGKIFTRSVIYASESWVMTKPGLFQKKAAVAGHPTRKLFKDIVYHPAWENMSRWNEYNAAKKNFCAVNPVTLDMYGNLVVRSDSYAGKTRVKKEIEKTLTKLRPGLLKVK
ncbi:MAG TPA: hypothetical protein VIZ28_06675 [Chitinophagaceae bacterium]